MKCPPRKYIAFLVWDTLPSVKKSQCDGVRQSLKAWVSRRKRDSWQPCNSIYLLCVPCDHWLIFASLIIDCGSTLLPPEVLHLLDFLNLLLHVFHIIEENPEVVDRGHFVDIEKTCTDISQSLNGHTLRKVFQRTHMAIFVYNGTAKKIFTLLVVLTPILWINTYK